VSRADCLVLDRSLRDGAQANEGKGKHGAELFAAGDGYNPLEMRREEGQSSSPKRVVFVIALCLVIHSLTSGKT
jgi:hypothetical protein